MQHRISKLVEVNIDSHLHDINSSTPETRLAAAVLERAICDLFSEDQTEKREAKKWFKECDKSIRPFSFRWVSEALGFENGAHKKLREAIFKLDFFKFHSRTKMIGGCNRVSYNRESDKAISKKVASWYRSRF